MDLYKSESEFIASLDYLCPPVKRISTKDFYGLSYNAEARDINSFPKNKKRKVEREKLRSSTSFIIKKASKIETIKEYCFSSYTTLQSSNRSLLSLSRTSNRQYRKYKRSIKVLVIPESNQKQTRKLHKKHRNPQKIIQSTLSDQDNSIHTKNLYLIVTGRRNKLYEIKSSGSATFTSDQTDNCSKYDDISVQGLSHVRHLIQSLNMDQKKGKKDHDVEGSTEALHEKAIDPSDSEGYRRQNLLGIKNRTANRSRVRIYGQLGLTEDDRYVLRYGATVNEKPVTDFDNLTYDILRPLTPPEGYGTQCNDPGKESQGTQVNFNIQAPIRSQHRPASTFDKDIQCGCNEIVINRTGEIVKCQENGGADSHSPLLIISVYSKSCQENPVKCIKYTPDDKQIISKPNKITAKAQSMPKTKPNKSTEKTAIELRKNDSKEKKNIATNNFNERHTNSRRPLSPIKKPSKSKVQDKQTEKKVHKTQADLSPDRFKAIKDIKNKILEKEKSKSDVDPSTSKFNGSGLNKNTPHSPLKSGIPSSKQVSKNKVPSRKSSPTHSEEKGTITEHAKAKKNLVENYTNKFLEKWNYKDVAPTTLNSKVAINIEGDKECYDVSFDQSKLSTNVKIKKTMKDMASQRSYQCKSVGSQKTCAEMSPSLENLLFLPEKDQEMQQIIKSSYSKQVNEYPGAGQTPTRRMSGYSGITIRDSLEISHRREDKHYGVTKDSHHCTSHCNNDIVHNTEILAQMKHYTGDDCSICDPIVRDKQIRELLGVDNSKCVSSKFPQVYSENDQYPLQCVYRRKCDESYIDDRIIREYYSDVLFSLENHENDKTDCPTYDKQVFGEVPEMQKIDTVHQQSLLNKAKSKRISKSKPIILSRKQYYKVKRTIQSNLNVNTVNQEIFGKPGKYKSNYDTQNKLKVLHFDRAVQAKLPSQEPRKVRYLIGSSKLRPRYNNNSNRKYVNPSRTKYQAPRSNRHHRRNRHHARYFSKMRQIRREYYGGHKENCQDKAKYRSYRNHYTANDELHQDNNRKQRTGQDAVTSDDEYGLRLGLNAQYITNYVIPKGNGDCNTENKGLLNLKYQPTIEEQNGTSVNESHRSFSEQFSRQINIGSKTHSSFSENSKSYEILENRIIKRTKLLPELDKLPTEDDQLFDEDKVVEEYLGQDKIQTVQTRQLAERPKSIKEPGKHDTKGNYYGFNMNKEVLKLQCAEYPKRIIEFRDNDRCSRNGKHSYKESNKRSEKKEPLQLLYDGKLNDRNANSIKKSSKIVTPFNAQYTSMAQSDLAVFSHSNCGRAQSIKTLFREARRKKSRSVNLGTSVCSMVADDACNTNRTVTGPQHLNTKKPFLKRLVSFFIMRSARTVDFQEPAFVPASISTGNSYRISSFGGMEMTSSIYDTSASFYSNHSLYPPISKTKRGFLNYFSCLITNRKS